MSDLAATQRHRRSHNLNRSSISHSMRQSRSKSLLSYAQQINVMGFPSGTTTEEVHSVMEKFGTVTSVVQNQVPTEEIKETIPFIVTFSTSSEARNALENMKSVIFKDAHIKASHVIPIEKETRASRTILVRRIPKATTIDDVKQIFGKFGEIVQINKVSQSTPEAEQTYWKCLIGYTSFDAASEAMQEMNGMCIFDPKGLCIKFVDDQNEAQGPSSPTTMGPRKLSRRDSRTSISSNDLFNISLIASAIKGEIDPSE